MHFGINGRYQLFVLSRQPGTQKIKKKIVDRLKIHLFQKKKYWFMSTFFPSKCLRRRLIQMYFYDQCPPVWKQKAWTLTRLTGIGEFNFGEQIIRGCHWDELRSEGGGHLAVAGSRVAMSKNSPEVLFKTTFIWRWQIISWQALQGTPIRPKWPSSL